MQTAPARRSAALDVPVLAAGLATTAAALAAVPWLGSAWDVQLMGYYLWFVVPAGALAVGAASGSGYGLVSWFSGRKVSGRLLGAVGTLLAGAYGAAQWLEWKGLALVADDGTAIGFLSYYDIVTRSIEFTLSSHGSSQGNTIGPFGVWGYGVRVLELAGFVGGGLLVPLALRAKPYCDACGVYMRTRALGLIPAAVPARKVKKSDAEGKAAYAEEMRAAAESGLGQLQQLLKAAAAQEPGPIQETFARHADQKAIAKLERRVSVQLSSCPGCRAGLLQASLLTGQGKQLRSEQLAAQPVSAEFVSGL